MEDDTKNIEVNFTKFNGGKTVPAVGTLTKLTDDAVYISYSGDPEEPKTAKFRRAPGSKAGWGVGDAKFWRITEVERTRYCIPDIPKKRIP